MRYAILSTILTFLIGLFAAGQALGAGEMKEHKYGAASGQQEEVSGQQVSASDLSSEQIRELQEALKDKGADPGPVDGIVGPKTKQAIRDFQEEQGIASTGQLDQESLEALDLDAEEFGLSPAFGEEAERKESGSEPMESEKRTEGSEAEKL
jgi:peptidoglycan hydrolase-like protein with peptidoglycan-binding domain